MKIIKYILYIPILFVCSFLVSAMFDVIWDFGLITDFSAKLFFTMCIVSFFCLLSLSIIDKRKN